MSSIRLRKDQIERLRASGQGPEIIRWAVSRYRRGDFVTGKRKEKKTSEELLQVYSLWRKPSGISDAKLREILDAHFSQPDLILQKKQAEEIALLDKVIEQELKLIKKVQFILETQGEE